MREVVFENSEDFYSKMLGKQILPEYGPVHLFWTKMQFVKDPNICGCKKNKNMTDEIPKIYLSIPAQIRHDPLRQSIKDLFIADVLIFKHEGLEFSRIT